MSGLNKKPFHKVPESFLGPFSSMPIYYMPSTEYDPEECDIIVTSYPKCGATWVSHIVHLLTKGQRCTSAEEYFYSVPFLEMVKPEVLKYAAMPRCIKSHLPFDRLKFSRDAKYIYITRHPIDLVVPLYHHLKSFPAYFFDSTFDEFLDQFCEGDLPCGDYYEHLMSGCSGRFNSNVLFLKFDEVKKGLKGAILRIAEFIKDNDMKKEYSYRGKNLKDLLYCCSLEYTEKIIGQFCKDSLMMKQLSKEYQFPTDQIMSNSNDESHEEIVLSEEHVKKLKKYIDDKTYGDYFPLLHDWGAT